MVDAGRGTEGALLEREEVADIEGGADREEPKTADWSRRNLVSCCVDCESDELSRNN